MTRTPLDHMHCSLARTANIIGDKWCLLILRDVFVGIRSFSNLQRNSGIARNILADRLEHLVKNNVLEKRRTRPGVERFHYYFTEQGKELVPILLAMVQWGDRWIFGENQEPLQLLDKKNLQPIRPIQVFSEEGEALHTDYILPSPGPGADPTVSRAFSKSK